jgi:hypothetical protein
MTLRLDGLEEVVMNGSTLPRRLPERLAALEALWTAIANDVAAGLDEMVASGWPPADALDAARHGYLEWFVGNVTDAVQFGADWWESAPS